jgi:hypothetical protein
MLSRVNRVYLGAQLVASITSRACRTGNNRCTIPLSDVFKDFASLFQARENTGPPRFREVLMLIEVLVRGRTEPSSNGAAVPAQLA